MKLLNNLDNLPSNIQTPNYDPTQLPIGIVHFGIGNFHRAHQAVYTEDAIEHYFAEKQTLPAWGICGVSFRSSKIKKILKQQQYLYSVTERDAQCSHTRIIGCVRDVLFAPEDGTILLAQLLSPYIKTLTLTVTEKAYFADCSADIELIKQNEFPNTVLGWLYLAIRERKRNQSSTLTLISCDNIMHNGDVLKKVLLDFAKQIAPDFTNWIASNIAFPNTMVDRITPASKQDFINDISQTLTCQDNAAILTEPFKQWVVQNIFSTHPPAWDSVGAQFVEDVTPFEIYKLRLLNACHSALAYTGILSGCQYIHETVMKPDLHNFAKQLLDVITPTLNPNNNIDTESYKQSILQRFANSAIPYKTTQVAMDGSQKLPQRIMPSIDACYQQDLPVQHLIMVVASWLRYITGEDDKGNRYEIDDPMAAQFKNIVNKDLNAYVDNMLELKQIFGHRLATNHDFRKALINYLQIIYHNNSFEVF